MVSLASHYSNFQISPTYEIPQSLREILYTAWQFQYKELYEENAQNTISLEETLNQILEALNSDNLGHQRYIMMSIILAKAVEPTILAYQLNWWLLEVVPASWCLEYPKFIYTINQV